MYDYICDRLFRQSLPNVPDWQTGNFPVLEDDFSNFQYDASHASLERKWQPLPANGSVRVLPEIIDGSLAARDSGSYLTAAYISTKLDSIAEEIRSEISFSSGFRGGAATIILSKTVTTDRSDIGYIVNDGSIHLAFSNAKVSVGLFKDNDLFVAKTFFYPTPLPRDGTKFIVGFNVKGRNLTVIAPGLRGAEIEHDRVETLIGPYLTLEVFWKKGQCQPRFHKIVAA